MSAIPSTRPMLSEGLADALARAQAQVNALVLGKSHEVRLAFVALLSDGHLLIEDLPGLGKTTLAHALAATLGLTFQRVQFTSDLLPAEKIEEPKNTAVVLISDVPPVSAVQQPFRRGDVNADGRVDIADPLSTLNALFVGEPPADCEKAADANDDGSVDLADPVFLLAHLFDGGARPPRPYHTCGADATTDRLSCVAFPICR